MDIRSVGPADAPALSALVHRSFNTLVAADWEPPAREVFLRGTSPAGLAERLQAPAYAAAAFDADQPAGFILLPQPALLGMLFVDPEQLRRSIGRQLWDAARTVVELHHSSVRTVELNATPYAFGFYRAVGFVPISAEFLVDGCRATRMACWLPARRLGAELL